MITRTKIICDSTDEKKVIIKETIKEDSHGFYREIRENSQPSIQREIVWY